MVRVKGINTCSFPLLAYIVPAAAIERHKDEIGITQKQVFAITHHIAVEIEKLFDLAPFPLDLDTDKLVDAAYDQGWNEALQTAIDALTTSHPKETPQY
jgi:hypothetical protein